MSVIRFPDNLNEDCIKLDIGPYPGAAASQAAASTSYEGSTKAFDEKFRVESSIFLPMPNDINSTFTGNWGNKNTTALAQAALGIVAGPASSVLTGDVKGAVTSLLNKIKSGGSYISVASAVGADGVQYLGDQFSQLPGMGSNLTTNDILTLTQGKILNPNTELLYGGPNLRPHAYSFKLIAQSEKEAKTIIPDIVKILHKASLPPKTTGIFGLQDRNFIGVPDLIRVTFLKSDGTENEYLPKYRVSGIQSVSASYITDGNYISYKDGEPLGINLSISLTETKLVFRDDLGEIAR